MSSQDSANNDYIPNGLRRSLRKKYAVKSTRVQALFDGMTHRPAVLKEGYLHKPAFFRFVSSKLVLLFSAIVLAMRRAHLMLFCISAVGRSQKKMVCIAGLFPCRSQPGYLRR